MMALNSRRGAAIFHYLWGGCNPVGAIAAGLIRPGLCFLWPEAPVASALHPFGSLLLLFLWHCFASRVIVRVSSHPPFEKETPEGSPVSNKKTRMF